MATFLTPDKVEYRKFGNRLLTVYQKIMPDDLVATKKVADHVLAGQKMKPCAPLHGDGVPQGITVHNTNMITPAKGTTAAEQYVRATYNGNMSGVVVHYYVWHSEIWQLLSDHERGWHATDGATRRLSKDGKGMIGGNIDTIAIEAIGGDAETEETTAQLCAWLCREYGLAPLTDIYPHRYFFAKDCPTYILPHWDSFLKRVKTIFLEPDETVEKPADEPDEWAADAWKYCKVMKYMDGTRPHDYVTRQELAMVITRIETE